MKALRNFLKPKASYCAARSVHLSYETDGEVEAFYNEVTVEQSTNGSYFMVCGWNKGYFGIQQLSSDQEKIAIFSVWDPTEGDDPCQVAEECQVQTQDICPAVDVHRFGGEGTGGKLTTPFHWHIGETISCYVTARLNGHLSCYTGWIKSADSQWRRLGTLKTRANGAHLDGLYSFVEDFRRDYHSVHDVRRAAFGNGWMKPLRGNWQPLTSARFTASNADWEAKKSINAGSCSGKFFLCTGGNTRMTNDLHSTIQCTNCTFPNLPS